MRGVNIDLRYLICDLRAVDGAGARGVAGTVAGTRRHVAGDKAVTCHRSPKGPEWVVGLVCDDARPRLCLLPRGEDFTGHGFGRSIAYWTSPAGYMRSRGCHPDGAGIFGFILAWVALTASHVSSLRDF
jgi:hypothetical protein